MVPLMGIGTLEITSYNVATGPDRVEVKQSPNWTDVEKAIHQLDRCCFPHIALFVSPAPLEGSCPDFEVVGGSGAYCVTIYHDKVPLRLQNPSAGEAEIDVWVSNQGASVPAYMVCDSLDVVLRAARYFVERCAPDPEFTWA
jgi:hypothetical protein